MAKDRNFTQEQLNVLLNRLNPVREKAVARYEKLYNTLVRLFLKRGFSDAEEMADETIDRVILAKNLDRFPELQDTYFYKVAGRLILERLRRRRKQVEFDEDGNPMVQSPPLLEEKEVDEESEAEYDCLMSCLETLKPHGRSLVLSYYEVSGSDKIKHRRSIAEGLGITEDALRVRVHRLKRRLEECILKCVQNKAKKPEGNVLTK